MTMMMVILNKSIAIYENMMAIAIMMMMMMMMMTMIMQSNSLLAH
jgi:hypothetical protein